VKRRARSLPVSWALHLALLWLAGADLRFTILAVPPVLPLIHSDLSLSEKAVGALSGLPVLLLGLAAIPGALLIARLGTRRAIIVGLVVVAAASCARGIGPSVPMLFAATLLMGAGVSVLQPALPSLVALWFLDSPGFATAVYANGLLVGEALPAALTIPLVLPLVGGSWQASFVVWALPVAATVLLFAFSTSDQRKVPGLPRARWWSDWKSRHTWELGLGLGGISGLYFSTNAFIPDYLHAIGRPELVGPALSALNIGQIPASLLAFFIAQRLSVGKWAYVFLPLVSLLGIAALLGASAPIIVAGSGLIGFCASFTMILALALPPQIVGASEVHRLSAGMFGIAYTLSFVIPLLGGAIWDSTGTPASAFAGSALAAAIAVGAGLSRRPLRASAPGKPFPPIAS
jgi:MFS transporter, CP family, cyanate transporter